MHREVSITVSPDVNSDLLGWELQGKREIKGIKGT